MKIILHIGPRKCGKSLFIEKQLKDVYPKLYIGTLPNEAKYNDCIKKHQARRKTPWELYETTVDFRLDCEKIARICKKEPKTMAIMLDGLTTWFKILNKESHITVSTFASEIAFMIRNCGGNWYLVDAIQASGETRSAMWQEHGQVQNEIIKLLDIKSIIDWNYECI